MRIKESFPDPADKYLISNLIEKLHQCKDLLEYYTHCHNSITKHVMEKGNKCNCDSCKISDILIEKIKEI